MRRGLLDFFFFPLLLSAMDMGGYGCARWRYSKGVGVWYIYIYNKGA